MLAKQAAPPDLCRLNTFLFTLFQTIVKPAARAAMLSSGIVLARPCHSPDKKRPSTSVQDNGTVMSLQAGTAGQASSLTRPPSFPANHT